ncbi:MAG: sortase [Patescibacteria group bacterium UBA2103]
MSTKANGFAYVLGTIFKNKWKFLAFSVLAFIFFVWILGKLDLLPEPDTSKSLSTITIASAAAAFPVVTDVEEVVVPEKPLRVSIPSLDIDVRVNNPYKSDIKTLDAALYDGVVRYPGSGMLGENGNVVIFGHSSYLPVVKNEYFKAFNGVQKLSTGDVIEVYGLDTVYRYEVASVYEADATDTRIALSKDSKKLTLSTCNSFGDLNDRYVVEAYFVGSTQISS